MSYEIKTIEEFESLANSNGVVVIHFWAVWNLHDETAKDILKELEKEFSREVKFGFLDTDQKPFWELLKTLPVKNVPSFAYFKNGKKISIEIGLRTKEDFRQIIKDILHN